MAKQKRKSHSKKGQKIYKKKSKILEKGATIPFKLRSELPYIAAIGVLTLLVFGISITYDFVNFDDLKHITTNPIVQELNGENVTTMFTEPVNKAYRPLSFLSFSVLYQLVGANASYYHLLNILIHLINVFLVYYLTFLLLKRREAAIIVTALFAIHPLHVESVVWVSALNDVLYGLFSFGAMINYVHYIQKGRKIIHIVYTSICFILAILSKPLAITLFAVFLLLDYWHGRKIFDSKVIIEKLPYLIIGIAIAYFTVWARNETSDEIANITNMYTFVDRIFFAFYGIWFYILKLFIPTGLSAFHAFPFKVGGSLPTYYFIIPLFVLGLAFLVYRTKTMRREVVFGTLFYLVNIALVLQLIPFGETVVAERYTYLSYFGLFLIIAKFYLNVIDGKFSFSKSIQQPLYYGMIGLGIVYALVAFNRVRTWENGITLFSDIKSNYTSPYIPLSVLSGLGHAHVRWDENFLASKSEFDQLIQLYPTQYPEAYNSRGNALMRMGDYQAAIADFTQGLKLRPDNVVLLKNRAESYLKMSNDNAALADANQILKINRDYAPAYAQIGHAYFNMRQYQTAINNYNKNIESEPYNGNALYFRGVAYYNIGNSGQACVDWNEALKYNYAEAQAMINQYCQE